MKRFWPLLPATVIALLLVALFCSRSRTGGTSTGTSLAAPTGSAPKLSSKIAPELIAKTMRGEVTRAIAVLQSSTNLGNEVKDLEKRLKGTVGSSGFRQLGTRPLVAIPTDLATLKQLDDAPQVVKVVTDRIARSSISRSAKQIEADKLWDAGKEGAEVSVAILDTGIDPTHPFLGGRVVKQVCYSQPDAYGHVSLCPNGQAKDESANAATPVDITIANHGTHVAGIAAGFNGTFRECRLDGIGRKADIVAIQVFTKSNVSTECDGAASCVVSFETNQIEALEYVKANHANLKIAAANLSLEDSAPSHGGACDDDLRKTPIDELFEVGVPTVIAAGNQEERYGVSSPGCITPAVTVGAVNVGNRPILSTGPMADLLAPGWCIASSIPSASYTVPDSGYVEMNGTSMAAPHVTGAIAALRAGENPPALPAVISAILAGAAKVIDCRTLLEKRLLNLQGALAQLAGPAPPGAIPGARPPQGGTSTPPEPGPGGSTPVGGTSTPPEPGPGSRPPAGTSSLPNLSPVNDCSVLDPEVCPAVCSAALAPSEAPTPPAAP